MNELDLHVHVLEPEKITFQDTFRRIAVGRHASIALDVDPWHPKSLPADIAFSGVDLCIYRCMYVC